MGVIMDNLQTVSNTNPTGPKYIPIELLINYADKGLSYEQIGKQVGCTSGNVSNRFKSFGYTPERVKAFNSAKTSILSVIQSKILNLISDEELQKAPLQTKVWCYGVLHDKQADLERKALSQTVDDSSYEDLTHQFQLIAARSPIVINNILQVVGQLPQDIRDRVAKMIPSTLPSGIIRDGELSP
jgi:hypothetical protein